MLCVWRMYRSGLQDLTVCPRLCFDNIFCIVACFPGMCYVWRMYRTGWQALTVWPVPCICTLYGCINSRDVVRVTYVQNRLTGFDCVARTVGLTERSNDIVAKEFFAFANALLLNANPNTQVNLHVLNYILTI